MQPYTPHRLLVQLGRPEEARKVKLPSGKKVRLRHEEWWHRVEHLVFFAGTYGFDLPTVCQQSPNVFDEEFEEASDGEGGIIHWGGC